MKLVIRCQAHPTYRGLRKPRVACEECEVIHRNRGATTTFSDHVSEGSVVLLNVRVGSA